MDNKEIRAGIPIEDVEPTENGVKVSGYAAVFGSETNIGGMFTEVIQRGAFKDAIGRDDVVFLINHEGLPLARTSSGTLKLTEDDHGLRMETVLEASDPDVQSILTKMKRGDLNKMSFAFYPEEQEWDDERSIPRRTIKRAALDDVSIVTRPAYDTTEIGLRSLTRYRKTSNFIAASLRRMRMKLKYPALRENGEGQSAPTPMP